MRPRAARKLASAGIALAALACLWFFFAPAALGGRTEYVVTHGVSMEPRFHSGDLAIVRSRGSYRVGEVVAYHSNTFHTIVLHRIVGRVGERYVFKGDNNNFVDFEHPLPGQLIGSLWIHVPGIGAELSSLSSPALVGGLIGLAVLLFTGAAFTNRRRPRGRARREQPPPARREPRVAHAKELPPAAAGVLVLGALALLPFLVLALLAFTRPQTSRQPYEVHYRQSGSLTYSASTTPGAAYEDGRAVTGEPLFTHVLNHVALHFSYRFRSPAPHAISGVASMSAALASTSGWSYTLPLAAPRRFHGDAAAVDAGLDLASLGALIRRVQSDTEASGSYSVTLHPRVALDGAVAERTLRTAFAPAIQFSIDSAELRPSAAGEISGSASATARALNPSSSGALSGRRSTPLQLSLVLATVSVADARTAAIAGLLLAALVILAALAFALGSPQRREEGERIRARFGHMIVPVERVWQLPGVPVIDVSGIDALVRIADHYERSILHERSPDGEAFWVTDESGKFRYAPEPAPAPAAAREWVDAMPEPEWVEPAADLPAPPQWRQAQHHVPPTLQAPAYEPPPHELTPAPEPVGEATPMPPALAANAPVPAPAVAAACAAGNEAPAESDPEPQGAWSERDPWAEQVAADALASGDHDVRAACEAAGVIFTAPPGTRH